MELQEAIKIKYKPHRGSLEETMKKAMEFNSQSELKEYLEKDYNKPIKSMTSEFYAYDDRIKWNLRCLNLVFENGEVLNNCAFIDIS